MILKAFRTCKIGSNRIVVRTMLHNVELKQSLQSGFLWFPYRVFSHFLPSHVVSSQRGASNCTQAPKAPPAPKVPEVPKAPRGFEGFLIWRKHLQICFERDILLDMFRSSILWGNDFVLFACFDPQSNYVLSHTDIASCWRGIDCKLIPARRISRIRSYLW